VVAVLVAVTSKRLNRQCQHICVLWALSVVVLLYVQDLEGKIVTACAGMPLALELAGGRLRYKRDIEQWQVTALLSLNMHCHYVHLFFTTCICFILGSTLSDGLC
jgi:hypothetical protein